MEESLTHRANENQAIDFLLANSAYYARFEEKYELDAIVTIGNRKGQNALEMRKTVARLLYLMQSENPALKAAKVYNWKRPADYSDVTACLRDIGVM